MRSRGLWLQTGCLCAVLTACSGKGSDPQPPSSSPPPSASPVTGTISPGKFETVKLNSEFLDAADYDANTKRLVLHFDDGSIYEYGAVPESMFALLRRAGNDAGGIFNDSIREKFKYTRIQGARKAAPRTKQGKAPRKTVQVNCPAIDRMPKQNLASDTLDSVSYDPASRCLVLYFDSKHIYKYADVPADVHRQLMQQGAKAGDYFNARIRNTYKSQRL